MSDITIRLSGNITNWPLAFEYFESSVYKPYKRHHLRLPNSFGKAAQGYSSLIKVSQAISSQD